MRASELRRALANNPELKASDTAGVADENPLAARFEGAWRALNGLPYVTEHRFHSVRLWRFDYAWPALRVGLELEGGIWSGGRHTRAAGYLDDIEKYNAAVMGGWRVVRLGTGFTAAQVEGIAEWLRSLQHGCEQH